MSEERAGWYAGYEIGLAIDRFRYSERGPKLSHAEAKAMAVFEVVAGPISALEEAFFRTGPIPCPCTILESSW